MKAHEPSLFSRLFIRVGLVLVIGASLLITAAWFYGQTAANKTYDQLLRGAAMQIAEGVTQIDGQLIVNLPSSAFELLGFAERDRIFYRIVGPDGAVVSGYPDLNIHDDLGAARRAPRLSTEIYRGAEVRMITVARALADQAEAGWVYVVLAQTTEARRALAGEVTQGAMLIVGVMVLLGLAGTFLAVRYALQPVTSLADALRQRNPEDLTPMQTPAPDELRPFVGAINSFMTRLDLRVVRLQQFIADAAHQIRTPLTALAAQVDMLDADAMSEADRERERRIKRRTFELAQLTNQLLSHAMVIHRAGVVQLEVINLVEVSRAAFHHAIPLTIDPDMVISFEAGETGLMVRGDPVSLREAIANIISNALSHGAISRLDVRVRRIEGRICVEVEDDGPGIAPENWDQMARRFNAASPKAGAASGLGFAIAAEVASAHDGIIRFREKGETGFTVILDLPSAGENGRVRYYFFALLLFGLPGVALAQSDEGTTTHFPALDTESARLVIHGAADTSALKPLLHDFQASEPHVAIDYTDFVTNELYREADRACREGSNFGDLLLSSSVDQMVKLANDGCALAHVSAQTRAAENHASNWRNEVYGFTFEPSVIVYHSDYVDPKEVPHTRAELADLLRRKQEFYRRHVATYDLRESGVGYLLAFLDAEQNSTAYGRLLESMSRVDTQLRCCNNSILSDLDERKIYIGYNIIGSYAYAASLRNPKLKIVLPRDYTLVLSRAAFIPKQARQAALAARFLDYLLSERGRRVAREQAFFFSRDGSLPPGVDGPPSLMESGVGRPVRIGPALLATQDGAQRKRFIDDWTEVMAAKAVHGSQ